MVFSFKLTATDYKPTIKEDMFENYLDILNEETALNPGVPAMGKLRRGHIERMDNLKEWRYESVMKCLHKSTGYELAVKLIPMYPGPETRRHTIRELEILKRYNCPYIVTFYGAYIDGEDIAVCTEFCEGRSLDAIYKRVQKMRGRISEGVLGKIAVSVGEAMLYLHKQNFIHDHIRPSNILVDKYGQIKLSDFTEWYQPGYLNVREMRNNTHYMAPERILGHSRNERSDVWLLGITILEVALGRYPYPPRGHPPLSIFETFDYIVYKPVPELPAEEPWSPLIRDFLGSSLTKDPAQRPTAQEMLSHPFVVKWSKEDVDIARFVRMVWSQL